MSGPMKTQADSVTEATELRGAALGENNGRLMAAYGCYDLSSNPHRKGTRARDAFIAAFQKARQS